MDGWMVEMGVGGGWGDRGEVFGDEDRTDQRQRVARAVLSLLCALFRVLSKVAFNCRLVVQTIWRLSLSLG